MNGYKGWSSPVYDAVVAAFVVSLTFSVLVFLDSGFLGALIGAVFAFFVASPVVGVAVLAWHNGCRVSTVFVIPFLMVFSSPLLPLPNIPLPNIVEGHVSVLRLYSDIPFIPSYATLFLIGVEWTFRERTAIDDFLHSTLGAVSVVMGIVHAIGGMALQFYARDMGYFISIGSFTRSGLMDVLGIFLVLVALFVVVVLPSFLWYTHRLLAPVAVITGWTVLGAWLNYLLWDSYPFSPIRGLGASLGTSPAPDYAMAVYGPLILILLTAVFEVAMRETDLKDWSTGKLAQ